VCGARSGSLLGNSLFDWGGAIAGRSGIATWLGCRRIDLGGRCLLGCRLLDGLDLFGLFGTSESVTLGAATDSVRLLLDNGRGMGFRSDAEGVGEVHNLCVGHPELFGELVHPRVLRQDLYSLSWCCVEPADRPTCR
jgi:hypothetical protein